MNYVHALLEFYNFVHHIDCIIATVHLHPESYRLALADPSWGIWGKCFPPTLPSPNPLL